MLQTAELSLQISLLHVIFDELFIHDFKNLPPHLSKLQWEKPAPTRHTSSQWSSTREHVPCHWAPLLTIVHTGSDPIHGRPHLSRSERWSIPSAHVPLSVQLDVPVKLFVLVMESLCLVWFVSHGIHLNTRIHEVLAEPCTAARSHHCWFYYCGSSECMDIHQAEH